MNALDTIKKAHVSIMRHKTFSAYSGFIACGDVTITEDIPTACTDGWNVLYNPGFVDSLTASEVRMLVLHEATHKAYSHMTMWRKLFEENAQLANIAADHFVNLALIEADAGEKFITVPKAGVQPDSKYSGWSVQMIYNDLLNNQDPDDPDGDGEGEGFDQHDWKSGASKTPQEMQAQETEIKRAARQGETIRQKLLGKGNDNRSGLFGDLLTPKIDWRKILRDFVTETCASRDESTWRKPNRRFLADDVYMPSMIGTTMTELVIGFDTSGSCFGGEEMTRFVTEITAIVADVNPSKVHVVYWDTRVAGHQIFEHGQFAVQNLKPQGGGGTDGSVLFDYLRDERIVPQAIVQFTDGYIGDWGRSDVPTLWAITAEHITAPFGTSVHLGV